MLACMSLVSYVAVRTDAAVAGKAALAEVDANATGIARSTRTQAATDTTWPRSVPLDAAPADPLGSLEIPSLGLRAALYAEASEINMNRGAVLIPRMAAPGEVGNLGIAAHRDGIFRPLELIGVGDAIAVRTAGFQYVYRVTSITVVERTDAALLRRTAEPSITLVTCYPFRYVGPAPKRFVVRGQLDSVREELAETALLRRNVQLL